MSAFFVIAFREGLEAFLVLGIVLAFLQVKQLHHIKKFAWGGFLAGVVSSCALGFIFAVVVDGFESEELQYDITLGVLFLAIVLLTYMVFWIRHNSVASNMRNKIEVSTNQKSITFLIVFTAVLREGLETVLFVLALVMGGSSEWASGFWGLVAGFTLSAAIVWVLFKSSLSMPLASFFRYSTFLLTFVVAGLVGLFIKGMQGADYLPSIIAPLYDSSFLLTNESFIGRFLGVLIGYDAKPSLIQFLGWSGYLILIYIVLKAKESKCKEHSS